VRLAEGRDDVAEPGTRNRETHAGATGHARITVRHEAESLFMAAGYVADARTGQSAIKLEVVHARNAEDVPHALRLERLDQVAPEGLAHVAVRHSAGPHLTSGVTGRIGGPRGRKALAPQATGLAASAGASLR